MTKIDAEDIQYHRNTTMLYFTKKQVIELVAAIDEKMKKVKDEVKGLVLITVPKPVGSKTIVGLWREKDESK